MSRSPDAVPVSATADRVQIGGFGIAFLAGADAPGAAAALVEHTLAPGLIGAPPHRHAHEDEISHVLEGTLTYGATG